MLLLHVMCQQGAPFDLITKMLDIYPDATKHKDKVGKIPLEYAIGQENPDTDIIDTLFVTHPVNEFADEGIVNRILLKIMKGEAER